MLVTSWIKEFVNARIAFKSAFQLEWNVGTVDNRQHTTTIDTILMNREAATTENMVERCETIW